MVDTTAVSQPNEYLAEIHGNDGMGDLFDHTRKAAARTVPFDVWLETTGGTELLLSLGPMTMVEPLMARHSAYFPIIMGGCVHTPPNFRGYEFNQCLDRRAFSYCTKVPHAAITLDTVRVEALDMRLREIEGEDIHAQILRADQKLSIARGEGGCYVWDDVAAAYLLWPERFRLIEEEDLDGNRICNAVYVSDKLYYKD